MLKRQHVVTEGSRQTQGFSMRKHPPPKLSLFVWPVIAGVGFSSVDTWQQAAAKTQGVLLPGLSGFYFIVEAAEPTTQPMFHR